jgi:N-acetylmuramoyl-L-alanine amidase
VRLRHENEPQSQPGACTTREAPDWSACKRRHVRSANIAWTLLWLAALVACAGCGAGGSARTSHLGATGREPVRAVLAAASARQPIEPTAFSSGACVAFAPTASARHLTVFLDAGHGGRDVGAVGSTESGRAIHEADQTLAVELDATAILRAAGFRVVVSRTRDTTVMRLRPGDISGGVLSVGGSHRDVLARDVCANKAHADVLVGIYFNGGESSDAGSVAGYDAVRRFAGENLRLARLLQGDVLAAMNAQGWRIPNDGVKPDVELGSVLNSQALSYGHLVLLGPAQRGYVSTPSRMPGALIEPLFITDPFEASIAASRRGQKVIAGGLARAIERYFTPGG